MLAARLMGQSWNLNSNQWQATTLIGFCLNAFYLGLFFVGLQWIDASLATILASMLPLLVTVLERLIFKKRITYLGTLGLFLGCAGVIFIMGNRLSNEVDIWGVSSCVMGILALAIATLFVSEASSGGNVLMVVGLQMLVGGFILAIASIFLETWNINWTSALVMAFSYIIIVPGLVATWVWFWLVKRIGPTGASTFRFLNPFFGIALAALILDEAITSYDYLGVTIISFGILAVQISRQKNL